MSAKGRAIQSLCLVLSVTGGLVARAPALADSVPFWGAKASVPIDTPINQLKKGEFLWMGEGVTAGPVVMVVSITEQRGYVYRNGILIGATTVSTVLSQASQLIVVYRNGIEIGRARLTVTGDTPIVNHALVLSEGPSSVPDPYVPDPRKFSWLRIGVPGHIGEQGTQVDPSAVARIKMPANFAARVNGILTPGGNLVCDE